MSKEVGKTKDTGGGRQQGGLGPKYNETIRPNGDVRDKTYQPVRDTLPPPRTTGDDKKK